MKRFTDKLLVKLGISGSRLRKMVDLVRAHRKKFVPSMISMMGVGWAAAARAYLIKPVLNMIFVNKNQTMLKILPLALLALVTGPRDAVAGQPVAVSHRPVHPRNAADV